MRYLPTVLTVCLIVLVVTVWLGLVGVINLHPL